MTRVTKIVGPAVLLLVAVLSLAWGLGYGGGAAERTLSDPGVFVRVGLPVAQLFVNLSAALMIGALLLAVLALKPASKEYDAAVDIAASGAGLFTVASGITGFFTFLNVTGTTPSLDDQFGAQLGLFFTGVELGRAWLITTLAGAVISVLCFAVRGQILIFFVGVLSVVALIPMATQGHAAESSGHDAAVTALALHLIFAAAWLGGLLVIVLLRGRLSVTALPVVLGRYSSAALVCFIVVAVSGYASAALRIGSLSQLATTYGVLVFVKVAALIVLGLFGAVYRTWMIRRLEQRGAAATGTFWGIVVAELGFMGLASGVAAALARTSPPIGETSTAALSPAEILTGEPLPPELTLATFFGGWNVDLLWLLACGFGIAFYIAGVIRLRRRGDSWPLYRSVLWVLGLLLLAWITSGGFNVYQDYLFSVHMLGHMGLTMMVPVLLVPGAPVTLAMRAIAKRQDGSRGAREWILLAVHSRFAGIISNPIVAAIMFVGSLWIFYYTELFRWSMSEHIGHLWMVTHFVITGYLFVQSLIGVDPVPYRLPYPFRLLLLLGTMAFHAFFGLAIMQASGLFLADWFGAMGRTWGATPMDDQQNGGGIAWGVGEVPTVIVAVVVAIQWSRSDTKEQKRLDRNADRTDNAELKAYNERLQRLADRD